MSVKLATPPATDPSLEELADASAHPEPPSWLPAEMLSYFKSHDALPEEVFYDPILEAARERNRDAARGYGVNSGIHADIQQQIEVPYDNKSPASQVLPLLEDLARQEEVHGGAGHVRTRWQVIPGVGASPRKVPVHEIISLKNAPKDGAVGADPLERGRIELNDDPVIEMLNEQNVQSAKGYVSGRFGQGTQRISVYCKAPAGAPAQGQITREEFHAESLKILVRKLGLSPKQEIADISWEDVPVTSVAGHENIYKRTFTVRITRKPGRDGTYHLSEDGLPVGRDGTLEPSISKLIREGRYIEIKSSDKNEILLEQQKKMLEFAYNGYECPVTGRGVSFIVDEELTPYRGPLPRPSGTGRTEEEQDESQDRKKANWRLDFPDRMVTFENEVTVPAAPPLGRIRITMVGYQNRGPKRTWGKVPIPDGVGDDELIKLGYVKNKKTDEWEVRVEKDGNLRFTDNFYKHSFPERVVQVNTMAYTGAYDKSGRVFSAGEFIVSDQNEINPQWEQYLNLGRYICNWHRQHPDVVAKVTTFRVAKAIDFMGAGNGKFTRYMFDIEGINVDEAGRPTMPKWKIPDIDGGSGKQRRNKDGSLVFIEPDKDGFWPIYKTTALNNMHRPLEQYTYQLWEAARRGRTASNGIGHNVVWSGTFDLPGNPSPRHANANFVFMRANDANLHSGEFKNRCPNYIKEYYPPSEWEKLRFKRREYLDSDVYFSYEDPCPVSPAIAGDRARHNFYGFVYRALNRYEEVENTRSARTYIHPSRAYLYDNPHAVVRDRSVRRVRSSDFPQFKN